MKNYLAAWRQKYPCNIVAFVDNEYESILRIPCPPSEDDSLDDKFYFKHLYHMYNLTRIQRGLLEALIPSSENRHY
jgi:hypothetical protein